MRLIFILLFFSTTLFSNAQFNLEYDKIFKEFTAFEKDMLSYSAKHINTKNWDSLLTDFELIWITDLPEVNNTFGLKKYRYYDKKVKPSSLAQVITYGNEYILIDEFDPPQGTFHDVKYYYKRKYAHQLDDLIQDTLIINFHSTLFSEDKGSPNRETIAKYPYAFKDIFNELTNKNLISNTDSALTFSLQYVFENRTTSGPLPLEGGHDKTIYKGNDLQIYAHELKLLDRGNSVMTMLKLGSFLYKIDDDYFYQINDEYIGNTSRFNSVTFCLKVAGLHLVKTVNGLYDEQNCSSNTVFNQLKDYTSPRITATNLTLDKTLILFENYRLLTAESISYNQHPTASSTSWHCNYYGNQSFINYKELMKDVQFEEGTFKTYNKGQYLYYAYFNENIGNTSDGFSGYYLFERKD